MVLSPISTTIVITGAVIHVAATSSGEVCDACARTTRSRRLVRRKDHGVRSRIKCNRREQRVRSPHVCARRLHADGPHGAGGEEEAAVAARDARVDQLDRTVDTARQRARHRHVDAHVVLVPVALALSCRSGTNRLDEGKAI